MRTSYNNKLVNPFVTFLVLTLAYLPLNVFGAATDAPTPVSIMQIQGSTQFSKYAKMLVETTGIVTLYNARGSSFWMQDPNGDGSPATSDAVFVSGGGFPKQGFKPNVGDLIRITAEVQEQKFGTALPLTRLRRVKVIEILSQFNPLPEAIELTELPSNSISKGIEYWEALEGMLVKISDAKVVAATTRFGEFTIISKANRKTKSGYFSDSGQLLIRSVGDQLVDYNPERIIVDDSTLQNAIIVQPGDEIESLLAVVDYTFSNYKLQPIEYKVEIESTSNETKTSDEEQHDKDKNILSLASYNLENLFDLKIHPTKNDRRSTPSAEALEIKLSKLVLAIQNKLGLPDILVVQEIENTDILQNLADRLNDQAHTRYDSISYESSDTRGIEVGIMWNKERVELKTAFQLSGTAVEQAFGADSASPGREPLVGKFDFNGNEIIVIGNHFKSKGGDDAIYGINQPPIRKTETQRKRQAHVVRNYVESLLLADTSANIVVTGDFNDFQFSEPGEGNDHPIAILEKTESPYALHNLIGEVKASKRFTFVFDGNSQVLDHMLVSAALYEHFKKIRIPHFNSNSATIFSTQAETANRSSDHDPLLTLFEFE